MSLSSITEWPNGYQPLEFLDGAESKHKNHFTADQVRGMVDSLSPEEGLKQILEQKYSYDQLVELTRHQPGMHDFLMNAEQGAQIWRDLYQRDFKEEGKGSAREIAANYKKQYFEKLLRELTPLRGQIINELKGTTATLKQEEVNGLNRFFDAVNLGGEIPLAKLLNAKGLNLNYLLFLALWLDLPFLKEATRERGARIEFSIYNLISNGFKWSYMRRKRVDDFLKKSINQPVDGSDTLLIEAIRYGYKRNVDLVLELGADVNVPSLNPLFEGDTPLITAAKKGDPALINLLLTNKANLEDKNKLDETALWAACYATHLAHSKLDAITLLVEHGADINTQNNKGETPLMVLEKYKHTTCVDYLKQKGAVQNNAINPNPVPINNGRDGMEALNPTGIQANPQNDQPKSSSFRKAIKDNKWGIGIGATLGTGWGLGFFVGGVGALVPWAIPIVVLVPMMISVAVNWNNSVTEAKLVLDQQWTPPLLTEIQSSDQSQLGNNVSNNLNEQLVPQQKTSPSSSIKQG